MTLTVCKFMVFSANWQLTAKQHTITKYVRIRKTACKSFASPKIMCILTTKNATFFTFLFESHTFSYPTRSKIRKQNESYTSVQSFHTRVHNFRAFHLPIFIFCAALSLLIFWNNFTTMCEQLLLMRNSLDVYLKLWNNTRHRRGNIFHKTHKHTRVDDANEISYSILTWKLPAHKNHYLLINECLPAI